MSNDFMAQLEKLATQGWDGIENAGQVIADGQKAALDAERAEALRQARIFLDCFGTEAGARCLALLREKTFEKPPSAIELEVGDLSAFALRQARRQGMAQIVHMIEAALAMARGEAEKEETE